MDNLTDRLFYSPARKADFEQILSRLPEIKFFLDCYILDKDKNVVKVTWREEIAWLACTSHSCRVVSQNQIGKFRVSTVFIMRPKYGSTNEYPLVFETMIFSPDEESCVYRHYSSWTEAEKGHRECLEELINRLTRK